MATISAGQGDDKVDYWNNSVSTTYSTYDYSTFRASSAGLTARPFVLSLVSARIAQNKFSKVGRPQRPKQIYTTYVTSNGPAFPVDNKQTVWY